MGFINLGTRIGTGTSAEPYEINYSRIRTVNCDDILQVAGSGSGGTNETLVITITYKYFALAYTATPQLLTTSITYTTQNGYDLEFNLNEYIDLFSEAITSASNTLARINAPEVNEFNPLGIQPAKRIPLTGSRSYSLTAGIS
tara:strand:- start:45 stop:473 length:429 start_codon:yes stop_codon:yes gene_type:complete